MSMLAEFKEFAMKGNVVDLAVGVVIGGAFGKIVTSVVSDLMMPLIGVLMGGINFTSLKWVIPSPLALSDPSKAATITYGNFLQTTVDFLIVAFAIFMLVKAINHAKQLTSKQAQEAVAPAAAVTEIDLLKEIRDLLEKPKA